MQTTVTKRLFTTSTFALACLLASCAAPRGAATDSWTSDGALVPRMASLDAAIARAPAPQGDLPSMDQVHPRTMITFGLGIGKQSNEVNTGNPDPLNPPAGVLTSTAKAFRGRLRGEHFFESGFGMFGESFYGYADDIDEDLGVPSSSYTSTGLFLAAGFRATLDDDFRMPVRLGPFLHRTERKSSTSSFGTLERQTVGVRLSAEPELIVVQSNHDGRISELSVFGELRAGAGPTTVKDNTDSEDGYAFMLDYEIGVRYRFGSGLLASLSYVGSKYHVGATESYNNAAVFFGLDDDFNGVMITAGARF